MPGAARPPAVLPPPLSPVTRRSSTTGLDEAARSTVVKGMVDFDAFAEAGSFKKYLASLEAADPSASRQGAPGLLDRRLQRLHDQLGQRHDGSGRPSRRSTRPRASSGPRGPGSSRSSRSEAGRTASTRWRTTSSGSSSASRAPLRPRLRGHEPPALRSEATRGEAGRPARQPGSALPPRRGPGHAST